MPDRAHAETPSILDRILADTRAEVARRKGHVSLDELRRRGADKAPAKSLSAALAQDGLSLIAEFKRASPSKGAILPGADPSQIVPVYERAGARAISVLTNEPYFGGTDGDLRAARAATELPILRKDFTVEPYQVYEARTLGADAVLLIVAALDDPVLRELHDIAQDLGMDALVETHDAEEIARAGAAGARIVGVNNRNLHTFGTSLETTERLRPLVPDGALVVSESGIFTGQDAARLRRAGVNGILVGESLMRGATDTGDAAAGITARIRDLLEPGDG